MWIRGEIQTGSKLFITIIPLNNSATVCNFPDKFWSGFEAVVLLVTPSKQVKKNDKLLKVTDEKPKCSETPWIYNV